jgi:hypothetical protein
MLVKLLFLFSQVLHTIIAQLKEVKGAILNPKMDQGVKIVDSKPNEFRCEASNSLTPKPGIIEESISSRSFAKGLKIFVKLKVSEFLILKLPIVNASVKYEMLEETIASSKLEFLK